MQTCTWCFLSDSESHEEDPDTPGKKRLCASSVSPPLEIHMTEEEIRLLRSVVEKVRQTKTLKRRCIALSLGRDELSAESDSQLGIVSNVGNS